MQKEIKWDLEADFVSIGSGLGGVISAIAAHDLGSEAVILEKDTKVGGVSAMSGGQVFCPNNYVMREAGIEDPEEKGREYLTWLGAGFNDPRLLDKLLSVSDKSLRYLKEKCGVKWMYLKNFPDYYYPHAPGSAAEGRYLECELLKGDVLGEWKDKVQSSPGMIPGITFSDVASWGGFTSLRSWDMNLLAERVQQDYRAGGPGMMAYIIKAAAIDRKIPIHMGTPAKRLITEDGAVIGVEAEKEDKPIFVRARKGVMIAISGYDNNEEMARHYEDVTEWRSSIPNLANGDNIVLGSDAGAALAKVPAGNLAGFLGLHLEGETYNDVDLWRSSLEAALPHAIWVNGKAERFCDETFYKDYCPRLRYFDGRTSSTPNFPAFLILDSTFREKYPVGPVLPGEPIPDSFMERADTLKELGKKLGLDGEVLEKTVERYNGFCEKGKDEDFGRGEYPWANTFIGGDDSLSNPQMGPLVKAPFFGRRLTYVSVGINAVGLKYNENAQVVNTRGNPIPGLYVAGNSAAYLDYGPGYQSGMGNMRGIAWAFVAAQHACNGKLL